MVKHMRTKGTYLFEEPYKVLEINRNTNVVLLNRGATYIWVNIKAFKRPSEKKE